MTEPPDLRNSERPNDEALRVAKSFASLTDAQRLQLISLLAKEASRGDLDKVDKQHLVNGESNSKTSTAGSFVTRVALPFVVFAAVARRLFRDRSIVRGSIVNTVPWLIALVAAPFVVPWTFERDRAAAEPRISIEYAFLAPHSQPLPRDTAALIEETSRQPIYRAFVQSRLMSGQLVDLAAFSMPGAGLGPEVRRQMLAEISSFRDYLLELQDTVKSERNELAVLSDKDLRSFAFRSLDDPSSLDETAPRDYLSKTLDQKVSNITSLLLTTDKLLEATTASSPSVRVRLTLLNRGATDGLVRHHGQLTYRGVSYPIVRAAAPSADFNAMAIPVFQTNVAVDDFAPQSVGKVEQDSMAEFWYAFTPVIESKAGNDTLCREGEQIEVVLYDQNNKAVSGALDCNQEES